MKLVHKDRQLDFVGWYTLLPTRGPDASILNVHRFFLSNYNESAVLLAMHPDQMRGSSSSGRLPLTIYDSNWEVDAATSGGAAAGGGDDKAMDDGEARALHLRFRELNYSVETDETEMISMNYVAAGAAGATTTAGLPGAAPRDDGRRAPRSIIESPIKGKRRLVENDPYSAAGSAAEDDNDDIDDADVALTRDEEEMIATLTTKANAIQMLQARINLIRKYLASLPVEGGSARSPAAPVAPSLPILRQIQALVSRLGLVIPSDKDAFDREMLHESNDVAVVDLLDQLMQGVDQARDTGKKHAVIEGAKLQMRRAGGGGEWSIPAAFAAATGDIMMQ